METTHYAPRVNGVNRRSHTLQMFCYAGGNETREGVYHQSFRNPTFRVADHPRSGLVCDYRGVYPNLATKHAYSSGNSFRRLRDPGASRNRRHGRSIARATTALDARLPSRFCRRSSPPIQNGCAGLKRGAGGSHTERGRRRFPARGPRYSDQ
jgi:hypothetical protein